MRPFSPRRFALRFALALALVSGAGVASAQQGNEPPLTAPDNLVVRGVPELPASAAAGLAPYENIRRARLVEWHPTERKMLIATRFADTTQLHEVARPGGARSQLTYYDEPAGNGSYRPSNPAQIALTRDVGGSENFQVYLFDRGNGETRLVTEGENRHTGVSWSPDGSLVGRG